MEYKKIYCVHKHQHQSQHYDQCEDQYLLSGDHNNDDNDDINTNNVNNSSNEIIVVLTIDTKINEQGINPYDDLEKNGIKTYVWGFIYWSIEHMIAPDLNGCCKEFYQFAKFFAQSPQDLLPCLFCRVSLRGFVLQPEHNIDGYLLNNRAEELFYVLHNTVNRKLFKPQASGEILTKYHKGTRSLKQFESLFWSWIKFIAFNFPADVRLTDHLTGHQSNKFRFPDDSKNAKELEQRLKTYILFFDLVKNFIPRKSKLRKQWCLAYIRNTPSLLTFSCRAQLLKWLHKMMLSCGQVKQSESFLTMMEYLHPSRSLN